MDRRELFLNRIRRLKCIIESGTEADLLDACAILRLLITEGHTLVDQVQAACQLRLKIRYVITDNSRFLATLMTMNPTFYAVLDGLYPAQSPNPTLTREVTRDNLLRERVIFANGQWYSLKQVFRYVCYTAGGLHASECPTDERELDEISRSIHVMGRSPSLAMIRPFAAIVATGLAELEAKVIDSIRSDLHPANIRAHQLLAQCGQVTVGQYLRNPQTNRSTKG